jgi:mRNA interferase RelE/StbE
MYAIKITPSAQHDLEKLKQRIRRGEFERLLLVIESLSINQQPHSSLKLIGMDDAYRVRIGNYRVIYKIFNKTQIILIGRIVRRNESTYNL